MSNKQHRLERLQKVKTTFKLIDKALEDEKASGRTLTRKHGELLTCWSEYSEAHNKALMFEKDEDLKKVTEDEHELIVEENDSVLDKLEERLDELKREEAEKVAPKELKLTVTLEEQREAKLLCCKGTMVDGLQRIERLKTALEKLVEPKKAQLETLGDSLEKLRNDLILKVEQNYLEVTENSSSLDQMKETEKAKQVDISQVHEVADGMMSRLIELTPEAAAPTEVNMESLAAAVAGVTSSQLETSFREGGARESSSTYKAYAKESIPDFNGQLRQYPSWRKEMKELVLPSLPSLQHQIRLLDKHTPTAVDLQNCESLEEAWRDLDTKYGNGENITTVLMDDFFKLRSASSLKSRSNQSKLVELKTLVMRLSSDLVAVEQQHVLHQNPYATSHVVKLMPEFWQNKWSEMKPSLLAGGEKTVWQALSAFLKDEAFRLETELPHFLDSAATKMEPTESLSSPETGDQLSKKQFKRLNTVNNRPESEVKPENAKKSPRYEEMKAKFGTCPHCRLHHTFIGRTKELLASDNLRNCSDFISLNPQQRAVIVEKKKVCANCLSWSHERKDCSREKRSCGVKSCALLHSPLLHGTSVAYVNLLKTGGKIERTEVRKRTQEKQEKCEEDVEDESHGFAKFLHLVAHKLPGRNLEMVFLLDDGSDTSLITHLMAGFLGLKGTKRLTYLMVAGESQPEGKMMLHFKVPITCNDGTEVLINCLGVETITENTNRRVDISQAYKLFPHVPEGALDRPQEEVSILIGQDQAALLAGGGREENLSGNLRAMQCNFGSGWCLGGWSPKIAGSCTQFSSSANLLRQSMVVPGPKVRLNLIKSTSCWPELEDPSCPLPRKCARCRNCQSCRYEVQDATRVEQRELELLKAAIHYDEEKKCCIASYPITGDPSQLQDNEWQAAAMAASLERQLIKRGKLDVYCQEFQDYLDRGVLVEVSRKDIEEHKKQGGLINFISHHGVETPHKATTKTRLVSNSSLKNSGKGPSVNALWPKGPLCLQPMDGVLLRFRSYEVACHYDIRKMYHSVPTTPEEKFLRLMIWRQNTDEPWRIFGYQVVAMGDRPAACILELVKSEAAKQGYDIDPETARKIVEDTYVDDGCTGGSTEEVARMIGEVELKEDGSLAYSGTVQQIFNKISFKLKMMVQSGEENKIALAKMGGAVLGHEWEPVEDMFIFKPKIFLGKKNRNGFHNGPELTGDTLFLLNSFQWTRRTVLSSIAGIYDPTGLISAFTVKFKLFLREVCMEGETPWDMPLQPRLQVKWEKLVVELVTMDPIRIQRSFRPQMASGPVELVGYSDGSLLAYCAALYYRQEVLVPKSGPWIEEYDKVKTWEAHLVVAKTRVAPLAGITSPRSEANGFRTLVKLSNLVLRSLREKPSRITMILDSECTIAAMESEHGHLTAYLANRRGEYLETLEAWATEYPDLQVDPLQHTPGPENISDIGTRSTVTSDMVAGGSDWQDGPVYLKEDRDTWPVSREFTRRIPASEVKKQDGHLQGQLWLASLNLLSRKMPVSLGREPGLSELLLERLQNILHYSDSLAKVEGILARVLRASRERRLYSTINEDSMKKPLLQQDLQAARRVMLQLAQPDVKRLLDSSPTGTKRKSKVKKGLEQADGARTYTSTFNMASLAPFREEGIFYTQGRFGNDLGKILGPTKLAILPSTCRLAKLMMIASHEESHRAGGDTCFRSRSRAWIVRARPLADRVAENCIRCKRDSRVHLSQQMGMLPVERTSFPCKPWTSTAVDFLGPYKVKAMNNARSKLKVWPVVFGCHITGALHSELAWTYGADVFCVVFSSFVSLRGRPDTVYTDRGSQLVKASSYLGAKEHPGDWDWGAVEEKTGREGTAWRFCPPGAQWRNGLAEQRVRAMKDTMDLVVPGGIENLNFAEFEAVLRRCCNIINDRPVGIRHHKPNTEGELLPLTPNLLLLGRTSTGPLDTAALEEEEGRFTRRACYIAELESQWWELWYRQVFDSLFPLPAWKERKKNLQVGDICLLGGKENLGKGSYRLCRVTSCLEDERGLVRTVEVEHRHRDSREKSLPYRSKDLVNTTVTAQNLVMICPVSEVPV